MATGTPGAASQPSSWGARAFHGRWGDPLLWWGQCSDLFVTQVRLARSIPLVRQRAQHTCLLVCIPGVVSGGMVWALNGIQGGFFLCTSETKSSTQQLFKPRQLSGVCKVSRLVGESRLNREVTVQTPDCTRFMDKTRQTLCPGAGHCSVTCVPRPDP